jgi:type I restriction enzyme S subunit
MKLLQYFKELTVRPKNAQELKGLILQLAVQGKLTANWRKDNKDVEPASELLKQIKKEKGQLVKDKKIKKEKPLKGIAKDEIPYQLPDGWAWCRLNDVCEYIQRGKSPKYTEIPKIPVISQKCVQWSGFDISRARFITEESLEKYVEARFLQKGDLLWNSTGDGTIGRVISYPGSNFEKVVADSHVTVVRSFKNFVDTEYLWIFTASPLIQNLVAGRVSGSTKQTELGTGTVKLMEFSFPPLEEQKEIVKVVETLFKEVEQLEQLTVARIGLKEDFVTSALNQLTTNNANQEWTFLQDHFKSFFNETSNIKKLRETVLQLAVQGKLTADWRANNPDTEDASVLLKRIQKEKAQLVKDKKIKKEKALPKITKEEIPYELPEGWVWCRLGNISSIRVGATPKREVAEYWNGTIPWVSSGEVANNFILDTREKITEKGLSESSVTIYPSGTVLVAMIGQGKTRGQTSILKIKAGTNQNVGGIIIFHNYLISEYLWHYFLGRYEKTRSNAVGGNQPAINGTKLKMSVFGLPPLEEQKAIVQKVNALMGLCDSLEQEVQQSQEHSEQLMQSCLREVFEGKESKDYKIEDSEYLMAAEDAVNIKNGK